MSPSSIIFLYFFSLLAAISLVALYLEHRRRQIEPAPSQDRIFRCEKCGFVYTDDADVDRSRCLHCGTVNDAIEF